MLVELQIKDFALIEDLKLSFSPGLQVLTGETGAGKTIIVEALGLLLGSRADTSKIRGGSKEAIVEGLFYLPENLNIPTDLHSFLGKNAELVISRRISLDGKSRSFINGSLATISQLAELGSHLVDLHGQHEHQSLLRPHLHLGFLDRYGEEYLQPWLQKYQKTYQEHKEVSQKLSDIRVKEGSKKERQELLSFQIREISQVNLHPGEDTEIQKELNLLRNYQKIFNSLASFRYLLDGLEGSNLGALEQLNQGKKEIASIVSWDPSQEEVLQRFDSILIELEDVVREIKDYADRVRFDPQRLNYLEERFYQIETLKRKYGPTVEEILTFKDKAQVELDSLSQTEETLIKLSVAQTELSQEIQEFGKKLSNSRRQVALNFQKEVLGQLKELAMERADFQVTFNLEKEPSGHGLDKVEFFISPNYGEELLPLAKIASGGEISRVMLALKIVLAKVDAIPTMVFDEIDAGIGGRTAAKVGEKLAFLSRNHQVICLTHLPQIAAFSDNHFQVAKMEKGNRTFTFVYSLKEEEKIAEISRMIGTKEQSLVATEHAKELLAEAQERKRIRA